ncbi:hypothetical protein M8J77_010265 [Diaphorina citri]|nr:hypothetical protein M8J77_010265 [Diaphorina citri]
MVGKLGKLAAFFSSKPNLDTSSAYNSSYSVYQKPTCYEDDVKSLQNFQRRSKGWSSLRLNRKLQKVMTEKEKKCLRYRSCTLLAKFALGMSFFVVFGSHCIRILILQDASHKMFTKTIRPLRNQIGTGKH